jgi:Flp pilus assembly protein TadB
MTSVNSPKHQFTEGTGAVPYLPLSEDDAPTEQSIGALVSDATRHLSTLVRSEVELAKTEIFGELKKALKGSLFFVIAGVIGLYSSFFLFFFLAQVLAIWLPVWAGFGIVFALMLVVVGLLGLLGYRKVKKIRAPQRTISSFKDTAAALKPHRGAQEDLSPERG